MKITNKYLKNIIKEEIKKIISEMYAGPTGTRWEPLDRGEMTKELIVMHTRLADEIGGTLYKLFDREEVISKLKPIQINLLAIITMLEESDTSLGEPADHDLSTRKGRFASLMGRSGPSA